MKIRASQTSNSLRNIQARQKRGVPGGQVFNWVLDLRYMVFKKRPVIFIMSHPQGNLDLKILRLVGAKDRRT